MGWGITLYPQIYYSKVDFKSKHDVEEEIDSTKKIIKMLEDKLMSLVMTTEPNKMMPKDYEGSPQEWLLFEYREIMEGFGDSLKRYYYELWKLELLYKNWDNAHNEHGQAICPPKEAFTECDTSYMDGDYIDSVFPNGDKTKKE